MGLAVSPNFKTDREIFVLGTFNDGQGKLVSRIIRFNEENGRGVNPQIIVDNLPAARIHSGGELSFGPDGMLYAAIGDVEKLNLVQDKNSAVGKILRFRRDGLIPPDNPFPNSPVFAIGVRNSQGFDWHPESKEMFAVEHGPSGFPEENNREHQDEMNVILKGENYGWSIVSGIAEDTRFINPLVDWTPAIAPGNVTIIKDKKSPFTDRFLLPECAVNSCGESRSKRQIIKPDGKLSMKNPFFINNLVGFAQLLSVPTDICILPTAIWTKADASKNFLRRKMTVYLD
ncbi:MAG: PQQ-dependent sugar dehydrogenase [Blastocatellia bacterium]|nr:PQQ-dependent sugar dehydrogenase [Blastocatellia bacterium]